MPAAPKRILIARAQRVFRSLGVSTPCWTLKPKEPKTREPASKLRRNEGPSGRTRQGGPVISSRPGKWIGKLICFDEPEAEEI